METEVLEKKSNQLVKSFDVTGSNLPDLAEAKEVPADLAGEYWTPEKEGEFKLGFIQQIEERSYQDFEDEDVLVNLKTVFLLEQRKDRSLVLIRNASKRLVSAVESAFEEGKIEIGTPLKITFLGKAKNKRNSYNSDRWSVRPLSA